MQALAFCLYYSTYKNYWYQKYYQSFNYYSTYIFDEFACLIKSTEIALLEFPVIILSTSSGEIQLTDINEEWDWVV